MKKALFLLLLLCSSVSYSHEYFFAFTEIEYDEMNGRIEATVSLTCHDYELYLQRNNVIKSDLRSCSKDSVRFSAIENDLNSHFQINLNPFVDNSVMDGVELIYFQLDGMEVLLNGTVQFYLSANVKRPLESFEMKFDTLMDENPEQQNKVTFIFRGKKSTYIFQPSKRTQIIDLY
jgi:hypothetical protein